MSNGIVREVIDDKPTAVADTAPMVAAERMVAAETTLLRVSRTELWFLRSGAVAAFLALGVLLGMLHR